jgi:hypothetical protein
MLGSVSIASQSLGLALGLASKNSLFKMMNAVAGFPIAAEGRLAGETRGHHPALEHVRPDRAADLLLLTCIGCGVNFVDGKAGRTRSASVAQEGQAMSHKVDANKHAKQPEESQGSEGSQGSGSNPLQQLEKEFAQLMQKQEQSQAAT